MMVIRGTITSSDEAGAIGLNANETHIFPADRCIWSQTAAPNRNGYLIGTVRFFPGAPLTGAASNNHVVVDNAQLGYIGKTGRFVEIAG